MRTPLGGISVGAALGTDGADVALLVGAALMLGATVTEGAADGALGACDHDGAALGTLGAPVSDGAPVRTPLGGISVGGAVGITRMGAPVREGDSVLNSHGVVGLYVGTLG